MLDVKADASRYHCFAMPICASSATNCHSPSREIRSRFIVAALNLRSSCLTQLSWVEKVAQPVAQQVKAQCGKQDEKPRRQRNPRRNFQQVLTFGDHLAPRRYRRRDAQAQVAEARFG